MGILERVAARADGARELPCHAVGERFVGQLGRNQQRRHVARVEARQLEAHQPAAALQPRQLAVGRDGRRRVGDHIPRHIQPDGNGCPLNSASNASSPV
jgi:hypothetical protein